MQSLYSLCINTLPPIGFVDLNGFIEWGVVYCIVSVKPILSILLKDVEVVASRLASSWEGQKKSFVKQENVEKRTTLGKE